MVIYKCTTTDNTLGTHRTDEKKQQKSLRVQAERSDKMREILPLAVSALGFCLYLAGYGKSGHYEEEKRGEDDI